MLSLIAALPERRRRLFKGGLPNNRRAEVDEPEVISASASGGCRARGGSSITTSSRLAVLEVRESARINFVDRRCCVIAAASR